MSKNQLSQNESLRKGDYLESSNGKWRAVLQDDGLVICSTVWASDTSASDIVRLAMQPDCDLVMYNQGGTPKWHTNTYSQNSRCVPQTCVSLDLHCRVQLTDDGTLIVYKGSQEVWSSARSYGMRLA